MLNFIQHNINNVCAEHKENQIYIYKKTIIIKWIDVITIY